MKKLLLITCALFIMTGYTFSQSAEKIDYRQKSKNQKTVAWLLLGVGAGLDIAGIATTAHNADKEIGTIFTESESVNHTSEYVLYIAGTAALAGSLILFISAKKNKKRAASISFKNEMAPQLQYAVVHYKPVPSLNLKIAF